MSVDEELRTLIPSAMDDIEAVNRAIARGYPAVGPIIPELLTWLRDYNWPVAKALAPFLAELGVALVPEIRRILKTDDDIWKYWILRCLVQSAEMREALRHELTRLATHPTASESRDAVV